MSAGGLEVPIRHSIFRSISKSGKYRFFFARERERESHLTTTEWHADFAARLMHNEGFRLRMYHDTMGIPTIGCGWNMQRPDTNAALRKIGIAPHDIDGVHSGAIALTSKQVGALLDISDAPIIPQARAELQPTHFDSMSDARRAAFADLNFNLGQDGLHQFYGFRGLIDQACHYAAHGMNDLAHTYYERAADDLAGTNYASEVGNRAKRNCLMLRSSGYVAIDAFE